MITCSRCGETLEDGTEVCYLCKHRLTASERVKADRIAEDFKPVLAAMKEYRKRSIRGVIVVAVAIVVFFIMAYVFVAFEPSTEIQTVGLIIWFIAFIAGFLWSKTNRCPWCGMYQGKRTGYSSLNSLNCRYCGKQLMSYEIDWDKEEDRKDEIY